MVCVFTVILDLMLFFYLLLVLLLFLVVVIVVVHSFVGLVMNLLLPIMTLKENTEVASVCRAGFYQLKNIECLHTRRTHYYGPSLC